MNFVDLSIKRPVLVIMLMIGLCLFGVIAYVTMPLNVTPAVAIPYVNVQVTYPGASPDLIETQIVKKIEDSVSMISGLKKITSYSLNNIGIVMIEFNLTKNADTALLETTNKVNNIKNDLPAGAHDPVIVKLNITEEPIFQIMLAANESTLNTTELYELADKKIKNQFSRIDGVGETKIIGGQKREIHIEMDNRVIYQNQISLIELNQVLANSNVKLPGGYFQNEGQDFSVKFEGEFPTIESIGELEVPAGLGKKKLQDIAVIKDSHEEAREKSIYFDFEIDKRYDNSILLQVTKSSDGNAVEIQKKLEKLIKNIREDLPDGVELYIAAEAASFTESVVADTLSNIIMGIVFTSIVLMLFLHSLKSTIIVAITMPLSILPTFIAMKSMGFSLNIMSMMGISTAVGVLVMNSVIILENIFRLKDLGYPGKIAASRGTTEIVLSVLASTLTNVAVFVPLGSMTGIVGKFLVEFAWSVVFATLFSLLVAFTLTPMMAAYILPEKNEKKSNPIGDFIEKGFKKIENGYRNIVAALLKNRRRCAILVIVVFGVFAWTLTLFKYIPMEFMPVMDQNQITIEVELDKGYDLSETVAISKLVEERVTKYSDVIQHGFVSAGRLSDDNVGVNLAKINLIVIPRENRKYTCLQMAGIITEDLSDIPGVDVRVKSSALNNAASGSPVDFYLKGPSMIELEKYQNILMPRIKKIPGIMNLTASNTGKIPEISLYPNLKKISDAGTSVQEIAYTMRSALAGIDKLTSYKENNEEYYIKVLITDDTINSFEDVANINIATPMGVFPVSYFADIKYTQGFSKISRHNKETVIQFQADVAAGYAVSNITDQIEAMTKELNMPFGYKYEPAGNTEDMNETNSEMVFVFIIAVILTYMLLAAILENFWQPVLILITVPLALIGIILFYLAIGMPMNFVGMMSIVMLVGMVVNNAILILDYTNQLCASGMSMKDALIEACPTKFKAILMSNIATILGMLPMAMGLGERGAEMRQPMGIVSISGLVTSTILTLFVTPATQFLVTSDKTRMKNRGLEFDKLVAEFDKKNSKTSELAGENK